MEKRAMDMVMIGDKYLASCFRLVGIEAIESSDDEASARKVKELFREDGCKILFITERVALKLKSFREELLKAKKFRPVFVIIPDFGGALGERMNELQQRVGEAIGVKMKL